MASLTDEGISPSNPKVPDGMIAGVQVLCSGDARQYGLGLFVPVAIKPDDPIFGPEGTLCPVSSMIGTPLLVRRAPMSTRNYERQELDNTQAYLMIDPVSGFAPPEWQGGRIGTALFVRQDKKPLAQNHLEGFWMFHDHLLDLFGDDQGASKAKAKMNPDSWARYWRNYKYNEMQNEYRLAVEPLGWDVTPDPMSI